LPGGGWNPDLPFVEGDGSLGPVVIAAFGFLDFFIFLFFDTNEKEPFFFFFETKGQKGTFHCRKQPAPSRNGQGEKERQDVKETKGVKGPH
jgi:hypothetical protein